MYFTTEFKIFCLNISLTIILRKPNEWFNDSPAYIWCVTVCLSVSFILQVKLKIIDYSSFIKWRFVCFVQMCVYVVYLYIHCITITDSLRFQTKLVRTSKRDFDWNKQNIKMSMTYSQFLIIIIITKFIGCIWNLTM